MQLQGEGNDIKNNIRFVNTALKRNLNLYSVKVTLTKAFYKYLLVFFGI